ncbi:MAG: OB-fold protein [Hyalangium sp.]|uniref:OB-fold protein n=1 Tax=Hyalangium sp. TaxID=2028555 RepID=UPI00389A8319
MALVKCRRCGTNMLKGAATCPGCGAPATRGMSSKKVLLVLGGLGLCVVGTCLLGVVGMALKGGRSQANSGPVEYMMLNSLLSEYRDNELRADSKFKGHIVEVTGYVQDVKKDLLNLPYVTIGSGPALEIPKVQCFLTSEHAQKATGLSKGMLATVRGRVDGLMGNVLVRDCELH